MSDAPSSQRHERPSPWGKRALSALGWLVSATLVMFLVRRVLNADIAHALELIRRAGLTTAVIVFPYPFAMAIDTFTGGLLLDTLGQKTRFRDLYAVRLACEAVLLSLPLGSALGESMSLFLLYRRCHVPPTQGIAVTVGKRWLLLRAHGSYVALSVLVGYRVLAEHSQALLHMNGLPWIVLASTLVPFGIALAMSATLKGGAAARGFGKLLNKVPIGWVRRWTQKRAERFSEADLALGRVLKQGPKAIRLYTALLLSAWMMDSIETLLILRVLGVQIGFVEVFSFEAGLSLVRSMAFIVPAGLGVQDLGYLAFFGALGIPDALAVGAAFLLLKRTKELFWVCTGYGILGWLRLQIGRVSARGARA